MARTPEALRRALRGLVAAALLVTGLLPAALRAHTGALSVLEVLLDGRPQTVGEFVIRDGAALATLAPWRSLGLRVPRELEASYAPDALVSAALLPGVKANLDSATQSLHLERAPDLTRVTQLGSAPSAAASDIARDVGALVNYDAVLQRSASRWHHAAQLGARAFGPVGMLEHGMVVSDSGPRSRLRLDTSYTQVDVPRMLRWRGGDFIAGGLAWTRPVRMAGAQLARDFSLRPDLVTMPTPSFAGAVAVPSTVDVLVNGVRQLSQPVEPGRFELRQLPIVSGAGNVAVVVRDALGRENVQTLPFYTVDRQLAPGLWSYSVEAGKVRRNYGLASNDYGPMAAGATLRAGLSDNVTAEGHFECTRGASVLGLSGLFSEPGIGALDAQVAASRGAGQHGTQIGVGAERHGPQGGFGVAYSRADPGFRDIAATQGQGVPLRSLRLNAGYSLGRWGSIGAAWVDQRSANPASGGGVLTAPLKLATVTYSLPLGPALAANVSAFRSVSGDRNRGVSFNLTLPFGPRSSSNANYVRDSRGATAIVQASQTATQVGEAGWRAQAEQRVSGQALSRQQAGVDYRAAQGNLSLEAERAGADNAVRAGASGALVFMAGALRATPPVPGSLAVVEVPMVPGVAVYRENRLVGHTDHNGQVVVPDLLPYQANRIAIDPLSMPLNAEFGAVRQEVRPVERSGVVLRYPVRTRSPALVSLVDSAGRPLPLGATAALRGDSTPYPVGHDGMVYLLEARADNELRVAWGGGAQCRARFRLSDADPATGRVGPVACRDDRAITARGGAP